MSARRTSLTSTSRRRSTGAPRLGAVKLGQSPLGASASEAGSPVSSSEPASALTTPQQQSPLAPAAGQASSAGTAHASSADSGHVAATAVAADVVAQFSQQLASSRSADRWLEERLAEPSNGGKGGPRRQEQLPASSQQQDGSVESAASQIVHKALRFITADSSPAGAGSVGVGAPVAAARKPSSTFDSQTFLDKGMDAISGVGRLMEGFAVTLDNVIGQAFGEWGASSSSSNALQARPKSAARLQPAAAPVRAAAGKENAGMQQAPAGAASKQQQGGSGGGHQTHIASFMSKLDAASEHEAAEWRKRAQHLASELQRVRVQHEEYQRLRLQYEKLQQDLQQTSSQASKLAEENSALKSSRGGQGMSPGSAADPAALDDPLAAQLVARQMEALLSEKSKLVAKNDLLLRENTALQELLEFTLAHQSQLAADGDLFGYDDCCDELGAVQLAEEGEQPLMPAAAGSQSPPSMPAVADGASGTAAVAATT